MSYLETLSVSKKHVIDLMVKAMNKRGITNKYVQAGVLAVVSKESGFTPKSEKGYGGTSNERIRKVFGGKVGHLSEAELTELKKDNVAFFNTVYGGRAGNAPNEGYKYRGRGLNQLTFKGNYKAMNQYTDEDIVANPDKVNEVEVAVDVLIGYYVRSFKNREDSHYLAQYNMTNINDATRLEDAVGAIYNSTAGWGKSKERIESRNSNGYQRAFARMQELYEHAIEIDPENNWEEPEPRDVQYFGLRASVGKGGKNKPEDVRLAKTLLNEKINAGLDPDDPEVDNATIDAIKQFQRDVVGMSRPDGRIDAGGGTWRALSEGVTPPDQGDDSNTDTGDNSSDDNNNSGDNNSDNSGGSSDDASNDDTSDQDDDNSQPSGWSGKAIKKSVGKGGKNNPEDVDIVKILLNEKINAGLTPGNSNVGPKTIAAIEKFQKDVAGFRNPDGRVDPGGKTWNALVDGATSGGNDEQGGNDDGAVAVQPTSLDASVFPCFN